MGFSGAHWSPWFINKCFDKKNPFRGGRNTQFTPAEKQEWKQAQINKLRKSRRQAVNDQPRSGMISR